MKMRQHSCYDVFFPSEEGDYQWILIPLDECHDTSALCVLYTQHAFIFFSHFFLVLNLLLCEPVIVLVSQNNNSKFIVVQGSTVHNCACTQQYIPVYLKICSEGRSQGVSVLTSKQRTKGQKKMHGGDGHVCYLDCGDSNTSGHVCPNTTYVNRVKFFVY